MEFTQIKWKEVQGPHVESEDFGMSLKMITLENGWTGVVEDKPAKANGAGASGFAAELDRVAQAAKQAEDSGDTDLKAAYDKLSDGSKKVLSRLKAGETDITESEWFDLRREMRDMGLMTQDEFWKSDPNIVILGYMDGDGAFVMYPGGGGALTPDLVDAHFLIGGAATYESGGVRYGRYWALEEWTGDPFKFLDTWMEAVRGWRDDLDQLVRPNGERYDTSHLTAQMEAKEKVNDLVKKLAELA